MPHPHAPTWPIPTCPLLQSTCVCAEAERAKAVKAKEAEAELKRRAREAEDREKAMRGAKWVHGGPNAMS